MKKNFRDVDSILNLIPKRYKFPTKSSNYALLKIAITVVIVLKAYKKAKLRTLNKNPKPNQST